MSADTQFHIGNFLTFLIIFYLLEMLEAPLILPDVTKILNLRVNHPRHPDPALRQVMSLYQEPVAHLA